MKTLESERLILRPTQTSDIAALSEMLGDPKIMKYLFGGEPLAEAENFIREHFSFEEDGGIGMGTLIRKRSEQIVGFAGLIKCLYLGEEDFELGFAIEGLAQESGYATEIGRRQIEFGFGELNCQRLLALVHPENAISLHILKNKLRMKMIGKELETNDRGLRQVLCLERPDYLRHRIYYQTSTLE
jgi:[ribosomal protein S5]-alanine N-acetyltransferase